MTTMTKKLVYFSELSEEAKEKAREWFREGNDTPMLGSHLTNVIKEKLEEKGFEVLGGSAEEDLKILYSLNYRQGDGVSFEGTLNRDGITYEVKQSGRYVHEFTLSVEATNANGEEVEVTEGNLEDIRKACKETEQVGYDTIEYEQSNEYVDECIEANEYTFTLEGLRLNPDEK